MICQNNLWSNLQFVKWFIYKKYDLSNDFFTLNRTFVKWFLTKNSWNDFCLKSVIHQIARDFFTIKMHLFHEKRTKCSRFFVRLDQVSMVNLYFISYLRYKCHLIKSDSTNYDFGKKCYSTIWQIVICEFCKNVIWRIKNLARDVIWGIIFLVKSWFNKLWFGELS